MTRFLTVLGLLLVMALPAQAQEAEIQGVISDQIRAFQADDFAKAFTYASPSIREVFRTHENFRRMVTQGYPMVWRPSSVEYLQLEDVGGDLWQKVQIVDAKGRVHLLAYRMLETADGWKINGVQILKSAGVAA